MTPVEFLLTVASVTGALSVLGVFAWRVVIRPHLQSAVFQAFDTPSFRESVGEIVEARITGAMAPVIAEMSMNGGKSVKDVVNRIDARLDDHIRMHG